MGKILSRKELMVGKLLVCCTIYFMNIWTIRQTDEIHAYHIYVWGLLRFAPTIINLRMSGSQALRCQYILARWSMWSLASQLLNSSYPQTALCACTLGIFLHVMKHSVLIDSHRHACKLTKLSQCHYQNHFLRYALAWNSSHTMVATYRWHKTATPLNNNFKLHTCTWVH